MTQPNDSITPVNSSTSTHPEPVTPAVPAIELTSDEARVLGVLVEKEKTTPDQYPLTLNSVMNGASQKNNRDPVEEYDEDQVRDALQGLRGKGLVIQSDSPGSRVPKYRHVATDKLRINTRELVLLTELMLRGPQTLGELRGRASRMHPFESLEMVRSTLDQLMSRPQPLVRELSPSPGSRAERYTQLLCPDDAETDSADAGDESSENVPLAPSGAGVSGSLLAERVTQLEEHVSRLESVVRRLAISLGESDAFATPSKGVSSPEP